MKAEALGFACLMTRVQALERTQDRSNLTTERMAKLSFSDLELDGKAEMVTSVLVHYLM